MEFTITDGHIYHRSPEGVILAEVVFPSDAHGIAQVNRTFVDESLRGQGVAAKLMLAMADYLQRTGKKAFPVCSYAVTWFEKHPEYAHLLAETHR